ncbi:MULTISPECIES: bifunctional phosphopantothenoylcysteine decarboxylase/phosphopantothenate--cysteine ligase CoaBC [unclassified Campylobacter]|uniref:bifunctional phosphopantothenoylcysteine decarboxylase/phosphopantothenate--cysteine ligase CoaBC n=1 Tax=unclassified Campylobacter TaxID=2593542 RepID=UPI001BDAF1CC|nr:bifunctional phosphopantothenoylcysteine decarboxylase/phosphopantothenate--cysteine ligase CoaBC [Campylobacter sp. 2018MI01]MBT0879163.1 bifunctional phosphopantothenoylcysteine decarboxylase/phosphopantothenate--cysteine ligase CoaBC [Campylobacter sp. 2018MI01]MBZ7976256.1 bifunctional phosphopantothenoylcysteine decarboxylase/phosphopantothenate--cysteine ligase CoaBC [Campylobacter sp. RM12637]MBZ7991468.1 bifunctional phosphopantothenoylcysteine decarboxylase/phosphopantothenate--cyste
MKVLLCVSGSISFYKSFELISMFKEEGIKVKALLSDGALKFVNKLAYEALCESVLTSENESWENDKNHIMFSKDCDAVVFAPASVNSINKLANGVCDNVFLSTLIASNKPLIIAPAANTNMYLASQTQKSLEYLKSLGVKIVKPISKTLACKEFGIGALANTKDIFLATLREIYKDKFYMGKNILITGGGTRESIDLVRNIGNYSSGTMSDALAKQAYLRGANVVYLKARCDEIKNENFTQLSYDTSAELKTLMQDYKEFDYLFMCAAVSDFIPIKQERKIKRDEFDEEFNIKIRPNDDLLATFNFSGKKIGFKLECDEKTAYDNAKKALVNKGLSLLCLNILGEHTQFGSSKNEIFFCDYSGISEGYFDTKENLAKIIFDRVKADV